MNDQNNPQQDQPQEIPVETRAFLESLLEDTHMQFVDDQQKNEILAQLYAKLDYYLTAKIVEALPESSLEEFTQMNEQGKTREEVEAYILEKIPNAQELFQNAFIEFRDLYVGTGEAVETSNQVAQPSTSMPTESTSMTQLNETLQGMEPKTEDASAIPVPPPPPPAPLPPVTEDTDGSNNMVN